MSEALQAYRYVAASDEFKERKRMRSKARHDERRLCTTQNYAGQKPSAKNGKA